MSVEDDGDCSDIIFIRMMITTMMMRIPDDDGDCSEIMNIRMMITIMMMIMMMMIPDNDDQEPVVSCTNCFNLF